MSEASIASQIASAARSSIAQHTRESRQAVKPQNAGRVELSAHTTHGSQTTMQFDSTGQVVPSAKGERKDSATANFVNLLA